MRHFIVSYVIYFLVTLAIVLASGRRFIARDKRLAAYVGALLRLMPAGQAYWQARTTYPFARWDMYGSTNPPDTYHEFLIRDDPGPEHPYPFADVAFSAPRAFMERVSQMVEACKCAGGDTLVDDVIAALASAHRDRTGRVITRFDVYDPQLGAGPLEPGRRTLRYDWHAKPEGSP